MGREDVLAWVESPLQLIGAAEWAASHGRTVPVAGRLTPQISATADELLARGARFGELAPYLGVPWSLLARHGHWLVGDGFSGQFRLAAAVLRPHRITFLDDGAYAIAYADTLLGRRPYARPNVAERGLTTVVAPFAAELVHRRAASRRAGMFTAFDLGADRLDGLADRGFGIRRHDFSWTRATAPAAPALGRRIVLGQRAAGRRAHDAGRLRAVGAGCRSRRRRVPPASPRDRRAAGRGRDGSRSADPPDRPAGGTRAGRGAASARRAHPPVEHHHDAAARARGDRCDGVHGCRRPRRRARAARHGRRPHERGRSPIIPARGGSKGIARKNLQRVGGVPLVARAVDAARRCPAIDRVVVTTDDADIAAVAAEWGAEIVERPAELSGDQASSEAALLHALDALEARKVDVGRARLPAGHVALHRRRRAHRGRAARAIPPARQRLLGGGDLRLPLGEGPRRRRRAHQPRDRRAPAPTGSRAALPRDRRLLRHACRGIPRRPAPVLRERRHRRGRTAHGDRDRHARRAGARAAARTARRP